ncbi:MAG: hypothetical protein RR382_09510 [Tannerellaceae bacterium]
MHQNRIDVWVYALHPRLPERRGEVWFSELRSAVLRAAARTLVKVGASFSAADRNIDRWLVG